MTSATEGQSADIAPAKAMNHYFGYALIGFFLGAFSHFLPGGLGVLLVVIVLAFCFRGAINMIEADKALRADLDAIRDGGYPKTFLAWWTNRRSTSIDRKYQLGWFAAIGVATVSITLLPPSIGGKIMGDLLLGAFAVLLVIFLRRRQSGTQFRQAIRKLKTS